VPTPIRIEATPDGQACLLSVKAQPGARRCGSAGAWNGMLKVAVASPAEDGRANAELVRAIAKMLGMKRSAVSLVSGERSREKRFRVEASAEVVAAKLKEWDA
jgi:uncharacterized protein (TIGR00251 family)